MLLSRMSLHKQYSSVLENLDEYADIQILDESKKIGDVCKIVHEFAGPGGHFTIIKNKRILIIKNIVENSWSVYNRTKEYQNRRNKVVLVKKRTPFSITQSKELHQFISEIYLFLKNEKCIA